MFFLNAQIQGTENENHQSLLLGQTVLFQVLSECCAKPGPDMAHIVIRVPFPTPQVVLLRGSLPWGSPLALLASSCIPFWQLDGLKEAVPTFHEKSAAL